MERNSWGGKRAGSCLFEPCAAIYIFAVWETCGEEGALVICGRHKRNSKTPYAPFGFAERGKRENILDSENSEGFGLVERDDVQKTRRDENKTATKNARTKEK
eukprot:GEMP01119682.1.p2 GENE.GEMP01119682.1~~GEMP01119682.1.p2  ORF type:complete len:103 (-),score=15.27 GEMP01119682.1:126-434(-)